MELIVFCNFAAKFEITINDESIRESEKILSEGRKEGWSVRDGMAHTAVYGYHTHHGVCVVAFGERPRSDGHGKSGGNGVHGTAVAALKYCRVCQLHMSSP